MWKQSIEDIEGVKEKRRVKNVWRRERDSNPRCPFRHTRFPGVYLQPLGHLSADAPLESYGSHANCRLHWSILWRRGWDSNPRFRVHGIPLFESGAFNLSATSPLINRRCDGFLFQTKMNYRSKQKYCHLGIQQSSCRFAQA